MKKEDFKQKFEPKGNRIFHGAGQSLETFTKYWNAVEDFKPAIYMTYVRINKIGLWSNRIKKEINKFPNLMLQIGLNLKVKGEGSKVKEISKGKYDKEIGLLCKTLREIKNPSFIRIGYEFNTPGRYKPRDFILAWKHIFNKFKENKVDNVATVWCACSPMSKNINEIMKYYPGDNLVDWFGDDIFGIRLFEEHKRTITEDFFKEAEKHKKAMMIGECSASKVGVLDGEKSWEKWYKPFFDWIRNHPVVKAFCYINWHWGIDWKQPEWGDCRIEKNEIVRKKYIKELSNRRYIHNQPISKLSSLVYN